MLRMVQRLCSQDRQRKHDGPEKARRPQKARRTRTRTRARALGQLFAKVGLQACGKFKQRKYDETKTRPPCPTTRALIAQPYAYGRRRCTVRRVELAST
jgi:hypothetical protein